MNVGSVVTRGFSRFGLNMVKIPTEEAASTIPRQPACMVYRSAVLLSMLGLSFSMFSVSQLQDQGCRPLAPK